MIIIKLKKIGEIIATVCLLIALQHVHAEAGKNELRTLIGKVDKVHSGDSLQLLLPDGEVVAISLAGIKSPPLDSAIGKQSQSWLSRQLAGQLVSADCKQNADRLYCDVFPDARNINHISLYHGFSQCDDTKIAISNQNLYELAENSAREKKIGLWASRYVNTQGGETGILVNQP